MCTFVNPKRVQKYDANEINCIKVNTCIVGVINYSVYSSFHKYVKILASDLYGY